MKHFATFIFFLAAMLFFAVPGCNINPGPEVPASSYGKVVDQLPDLPEAAERYSYPDYVELRHIPK